MTPAPPETAPNARATLPRVLAIAALAVAFVVAGRYLGRYIPLFAERIEALGAWGPLVFIVGYAVATVAFIPGSILTLAGGALFGVVNGTLYVFIGATIGETMAFLISRYVARARVERRVAANPKFAALDRAIGAEGRKVVFLLRLSPIFPFNLLNYALGLTQVRLIDYIIASIGILPGTILYVYYGKVAGDLAALAGGVGSARGKVYYFVLGLGLLATIAVTTVVARISRRALNSASPG